MEIRNTNGKKIGKLLEKCGNLGLALVRLDSLSTIGKPIDLGIPEVAILHAFYPPWLTPSA